MQQDVRDELREIGERREQQKLAEEKLAHDTAAAIRRARRAKVSMTEVARLVRLDRTYLYRGFV